MSWSAQFRQKLAQVGLVSAARVNPQQMEDLESLLLSADVGSTASTQILSALRLALKTNPSFLDALQKVLAEGFAAAPSKTVFPAERAEAGLQVVLILGVNGVGKTTSIGKLAYFLQQQGQQVLLAAGDTFRAAAREQLQVWAERSQAAFASNVNGDPGGIIFDAIQQARARALDVVLMDTAGRLPTQTHLIEELKKIQRVAAKALPDAPHERILVVDATTGQNMLTQIKAFDAAVQLTGLIVTKLDGSAKGGALLALAFDPQVRHLPIYFVGQGEGMRDLARFDRQRFVTSFLPAAL